MLLGLKNVRVHLLDVVDVREDEGLGRVEAEGQNVLHIVLSHLVRASWSFKLDLGLVDVFLVISDLNHEGHVENALKPLGENEGDAVTHVEGVSRGTSTRVQIERLLGLIGVQDLTDVTLAEKDAASNESMGLLSDGTFKTLDECFIDREASVLIDKFVVVDTLIVFGSDLPRCADILGSSCFNVLVFLNHSLKFRRVSFEFAKSKSNLWGFGVFWFC